MEKREEIKCSCGNDKFYAILIDGRGQFIELTCTKCGDTHEYGGG